MIVEFTLDGRPFMGLNGGPQFPFSEAISMTVDCADQAEIDHYWDALLADGGQPGPCGWLKDRFGVSWQVFPRALIQMHKTGKPEPANRAPEIGRAHVLTPATNAPHVYRLLLAKK